MKALYILSILAMANFSSYAQTNDLNVNWDSTISITQNQFETIALKATALLKNKNLSKISDLEHAEIIRLWNTTLQADLKTMEKDLFFYFIEIFYKVNYQTEILKLYPDKLSTPGNGYYFKKLKVELGGIFHSRSFFNIKS